MSKFNKIIPEFVGSIGYVVNKKMVPFNNLSRLDFVRFKHKRISSIEVKTINKKQVRLSSMSSSDYSLFLKSKYITRYALQQQDSINPFEEMRYNL